MKNSIILFLVFFVAIACKQDVKKAREKLVLDTQNPVVKQILSFKNKRNTKSLLPFLTVKNPAHRYIATVAFGSVQDTTAIAELANLLNDDYPEIRTAAAYALGQTKATSATPFLVDAFQRDTIRTVQAAILEAIGKCSNLEYLKHMSTAPSYPIQDSILWEGQALSLYRFALRGLVHKEGTTKIMNDFIANSLMASKARFVAANYLARTPNIDLTGYENVLINNVEEETDPNTLMFLVLGLAKTKTIAALNKLKSIYSKQKDYRVKCNILKGFRNFAYDSVKTIAFKALNDKNIHIQTSAAEYFYYQGKDIDAARYFEIGNNHSKWQVRGLMLGASLRNMVYFKSKTKSFYSSKIKVLYQNSTNLYEKASLLKALSNFSWNYRTIAQSMFSNNDTIKIPAIIRSAATEALVNIRKSKNYASELHLSKNRVTGELNLVFKRAIEQGDPAMIAIVAEMLATEDLHFNQTFPDYEFLKNTQAKLSLPSEIETYIYLQKAINYFEGKPQKKVTAESTSYTEIDWQLIRALKANNKINIQTSKGNITLKLLLDVAPATITQFINLVKAGYYNGKVFHRVIPNFVAQGGCSRGDGWSGFNVTVRSEFSPTANYHKEGMVGMASAGKDTESAQFFITHAPALHLDGNYTIFAKVTKGMDIVHKLEVGDAIIKIEIN